VLSFLILTLVLAGAFVAILVSLALTLSKAKIELPSSCPDRLLEARAKESPGRGGTPRARPDCAVPAEIGRAARASPAQRRPLAICAGDSITHGVVSVNYVEMLEKRLPDWDFSNAGVNSELAYNLVSRLDPIIALDPDVVTVLIGSNDVNATLGLRSFLGYYALHRLPEAPNILFFQENLTLIARRLKAETHARVAFLSIPPIGEDDRHYVFLRTEEYARVVAEVAEAEGIAYLPLRERLVAYLQSVPKGSPIPFARFTRAQANSVRSHILLGKTFDEISAANGFHLLVDGIHLNTHGASVIADLVEEFIRSQN
jgi:lysophospholipase L1-like esterase